jgi:hypothetical protein
MPQHLKVALLWHVDGENRDPAYQEVDMGTVASGPQGRSFSIPIRGVPSESLCTNVQGELLGVAGIIAFDDANQDGLMQATEMVGSVPDHMVTYASEAFPQALRAFPKDGRPIETLLQIKPGLQLNKSISPEAGGRAGGRDDLVPVPVRPVTLVIVPTGGRPRLPNWRR